MTADWLLTVAIAGGTIGLLTEVAVIVWITYDDFKHRFVFKDDLGRIELLRGKLRLLPKFYHREVNFSRHGLARGTLLFVGGGALAAVVLAIFAVGLVEVTGQ